MKTGRLVLFGLQDRVADDVHARYACEELLSLCSRSDAETVRRTVFVRSGRIRSGERQQERIRVVPRNHSSLDG